MLIGRIDQLMHTVEQLLMLSRAGQNFAKGQYQQVDLLNHMLEPLREELAEMLAGRQQRLITQGQIQREVEGDAVLLRLMLRNVVENAHRYSPPNSDITITLAERDQGVLVQIDDCGPGIDEKMAGELTEAFKRADQRFGGSGLGLNIVLRIINLHGGHLRLLNRQNSPGLSVQCWLPFRAFTPNSGE